MYMYMQYIDGCFDFMQNNFKEKYYHTKTNKIFNMAILG